MNPEVGLAKPFVGRSAFRYGTAACWSLAALLLAFAPRVAEASPRLNAADALGFFTNAASAMFARLNFQDHNGNRITVTNIPVWPDAEDCYRPAVHRILQLAANLFECTTTNLYPCVYRPLFASDGTHVWIGGYELVNGPDNAPTSPRFLTRPADLSDPAARSAIGTNLTEQNFYGVPWVIGAKKGFPNLNQLAVESITQMTRRLEIHRPSVRDGWLGYQGKQMFILGVSNILAVEVWNSYNSSYPRPLVVQADGSVTVQLTNDAGFAAAPLTFALSPESILIPANGLGATGLHPPFGQASQQPSPSAFVVPLQTNLVVLPDSVQLGSTLQPVDADSLSAIWDSLSWNNLAQPNWFLNVTNRIRCFVMDAGSGGRLVDYAQLNRMDGTRDLMSEALALDNRLGIWTSSDLTSGFWVTPANPMPAGVVQQIKISMGAVPTSAADWADNGLAAGSKASATAAFLAFMTAPTVTSNVIQAPFTPTAKVYQRILMEANDPLVHYLPEDLGTTYTTALIQPPQNATSVTNNVFGALYRLNDRYSPWGGNGPRTGWSDSNADPHLFDTALKDASIMTSDNWNFPTNEPLNFSWLGQVHRGTPWQTFYLKSADILATDETAWMNWSGSANLFDATNCAPITDWQLAAVLNSLLQTNDQSKLLSVNNPDTNAWLDRLDGLTAVTNSTILQSLNPIVLSSNSPQAIAIVAAVRQTRAAQSGGVFNDTGEILAVPQLSDASPFLDLGALHQVNAGGLTDAAMEILPSQLLALLRQDSFGTVRLDGDGQVRLQFTGDDQFSYAIEVSSNLVDWVRISTNTPFDGIFTYRTGPTVVPHHQFYRSILLP